MDAHACGVLCAPRQDDVLSVGTDGAYGGRGGGRGRRGEEDAAMLTTDVDA